MAVKNIIFDLGGVLLNLEFDKTRRAFEALGLHDFDQQFRLGYASNAFKEYEVGTLTDEQFLQALQEKMDNGVTLEKIETAWNALLLDFPTERVTFLQQLAQQYRLFLFSNTNAIHWNYFKKDFLQVHGFDMDLLFEKAYYSHEVGIRKPDAAAYQYVLNENALLPAETIFIDDALVNVEAANAIGIQGIQLTAGNTILDLGL